MKWLCLVAGEKTSVKTSQTFCFSTWQQKWEKHCLYELQPVVSLRESFHFLVGPQLARYPATVQMQPARASAVVVVRRRFIFKAGESQSSAVKEKRKRDTVANV